MKRIFKTYGLLVLIAGVIIALDQYTKSLVLENIPLNHIWQPEGWPIPWIRLVFVQNTGVAFGMFQNLGTLFTILPFFVTALIIYYYTQVPDPDWALKLALSLQMGGAIGNLIDRLTLGYVVDFFSVGNFPVFNVADASITVGVGILLLDMWIQDKRERAEKEAADALKISESDGDSGPVDEVVSS